MSIMSPKTSQKIMNVVFILSGIITLLILIIILGYILIKGLPVVNLEFLLGEPIDSGESGGIFPMIVSSIYVVLIAAIIGTPLGVGAAIYMSEYATNQKIIKFIRFGSETLASIPSIVFGLFGLAFFVVFLQLGWSILSAGLVLAIMAIPTIFQVAEVTLTSIPESYKEGSYGLGATKWQTIANVVLPAAIPGIITGIILLCSMPWTGSARLKNCMKRPGKWRRDCRLLLKQAPAEKIRKQKAQRPGQRKEHRRF